MAINKRVRTVGSNKDILSGIVTTTTSGTVGSQDCDGFTVTKTATETGRYTITLAEKYQTIEYAHGVVQLSADTAAVQAKGVACTLRGVDAAGKVAFMQFTIVPTDAAAGADAEVEDGAVLRFVVVVNTGQA